MNPLSKGLAILFGIPLTLSVIFSYYFIVTGEERMRANCAQILPGTSFEQLALFAQEHRLSAPSKDARINILEEPRNYGRHACRIVIESGVVKSSEYMLAE